MPVPVAGDVPEDLKIWIDEHAEELPGVAAERVAVRRYPYGQLAAHVLGYTGQIIDEEFEAKAGSSKPYTLNDKIGKYGVEKIYEDDLRGTPGSRSIEVDAENRPIRVVDRSSRSPATTSSSTSTSTCRPRRSRRCSPGLDRQGPPVHRCQSGPRPRRGPRWSSTRRPAGVRDGVVPHLQPRRLRRRDQRQRVGSPHRRGEQHAPQQLGDPGAVRARVHLQALQRGVGVESGLITPETTVYDDGEYEVPDCSGDSCAFSNDRGKAYGVVDMRRSLTVSSDFYYYGLGARFWIEQDRVGGPEKYADLLKQWGFDKDTGIDLSSEQAGRVPSPAWLREFCDERRLRGRRRQLAHRQQREHGHRAGRRAPHAAAARVGVRHHRQRRHRVAAPRGEGGA